MLRYYYLITVCEVIYLSEISYTISEFAALNRLTPRMLRHYDKVGLLKPASTANNGYRAYSAEQIVVASNIKRYRDCGFSLEEIAEIDEKEAVRL